MSKSSGIKMGVDPVMDKNLYDEPSKNRNDYVSSINPNDESDTDEDMVQDIQQKYAYIHPNPCTIHITPVLLSRSSSNQDKAALMQTDKEDADFDPMSQKHKQIQSKNNEYQNRQFDRGLTPARADPFSNVVSTKCNQSASTKPKLSSSRKEIVTDEPRSYRHIMTEREIQKDKQEAMDVISGKKKKFSDQTSDDDEDDDDNAHNKNKKSVLGKRKHNESNVCFC